MSLKDRYDSDSGKNTKPVTPFVRQLNRALDAACNPFFESPRKRTSREQYEACWRECVHPELSANESLAIRVNLGEFYHRNYPERVREIAEYKYILLNPATVIEVSDIQRAKEALGFTPESLRLPPEPSDMVPPREIAGYVKPRPTPPPTPTPPKPRPVVEPPKQEPVDEQEPEGVPVVFDDKQGDDLPF